MLLSGATVASTVRYHGCPRPHGRPLRRHHRALRCRRGPGRGVRLPIVARRPRHRPQPRPRAEPGLVLPLRPARPLVHEGEDREPRRGSSPRADRGRARPLVRTGRPPHRHRPHPDPERVRHGAGRAARDRRRHGGDPKDAQRPGAQGGPGARARPHPRPGRPPDDVRRDAGRGDLLRCADSVLLDVLRRKQQPQRGQSDRADPGAHHRADRGDADPARGVAVARVPGGRGRGVHARRPRGSGERA